MVSSNYILLVAGGSGMRMGSETPKQFLELNGKPILMHTIKKFKDLLPGSILKVVLPKSHKDFWLSLCQLHSFSIEHDIVEGGSTRFQSVKLGLDSIATNDGIVAIHDGVRPFVSNESILQSFSIAATHGNAIVSVPMKDSIRMLDGDENCAVDRSAYRSIQTPQTFQLALIKKAFETAELPIFTDDASVLEHAGHNIILIDGTYENIKITTPEDILFGEALLASRR